MSNVYSVVGTELHVAVGIPATADAEGYDALDFTEVGEVVDLGEYGAEAGVAEHQPLKTGVTVKRKGFINYGQQAVQLGRDISDAGQIILKNGVDGETRYDVHSFMVVHQDGLIQYFQGTVHGYTTNISGGDSIVGASANIEISSKILDVEPTP